MPGAGPDVGDWPWRNGFFDLLIVVTRFLGLPLVAGLSCVHALTGAAGAIFVALLKHNYY